jgi:hypothetical protein
MKLPVEKLQNITYRAVRLSADISKIAFRTAYLAGHSGFIVTHSLVELTFDTISPADAWMEGESGDRPVVPNHEQPEVASVDPLVEHAELLGPAVLFLTASSEA